jgi:UDP-N-acetylmuramoyl-tripeptide--D-alanyl-D-alanine ligase
MFKKIIQAQLEGYARRLLKKYQPKVITITGSVGKTSTKSALATVLRTQYKVLVSFSNMNTEFSVPVMLFGLEYPTNVHSPLAWVSVFRQMGRIIKNGYDYEVVVLELGTDQPGDIAQFAEYIQPDIAIVTAVSPEHMANFPDLDVVAREELSITAFSKMAIMNRDDVDHVYDQYCKAPVRYTYGFDQDADFQFKIGRFSLEYGFDGTFFGEGLGELATQVRVVGAHNVKPVLAAVAAATQLGVPRDKIAAGVAEVEPVNGRMTLLHGAEHSIILDDSYNSSPLAAKAALQTLYDFDAPSRIAILGSMNELGAHSQQAHQELGALCDPSKLEWVITVGEEAEKYLAPAVKASGCRVDSFRSPYDAAAFIRPKLQPGAVVLVKGSQNGVFTEETAKLLLAHPDDEKYLVRQSPQWLQIKRMQFSE